MWTREKREAHAAGRKLLVYARLRPERAALLAASDRNLSLSTDFSRIPSLAQSRTQVDLIILYVADGVSESSVAFANEVNGSRQFNFHFHSFRTKKSRKSSED